MDLYCFGIKWGTVRNTVQNYFRDILLIINIYDSVSGNRCLAADLWAMMFGKTVEFGPCSKLEMYIINLFKTRVTSIYIFLLYTKSLAFISVKMRVMIALEKGLHDGSGGLACVFYFILKQGKQ